MSNTQLEQDNRRYADCRPADVASAFSKRSLRERLHLELLRAWIILKAIGVITAAGIIILVIGLIFWGAGTSFTNAMKVTPEMRQECQTKCETEGFLEGHISIPSNIVCTCSNTKTFKMTPPPVEPTP